MNITEFKNAVDTLEVYISLYSMDIPYEIVDNAPNTYQGMRDFYDKNGFFGINGESSDKTIYSSPTYNFKFRAIHDQMHYDYNLSFSFEDEKKLSDITALTIRTWCQNMGYDNFHCENVYNLVQAEIRGQIEYYEKHNKFVDNQINFVKEYLGVE